jgi:hypothetical protein
MVEHYLERAWASSGEREREERKEVFKMCFRGGDRA